MATPNPKYLRFSSFAKAIQPTASPRSMSDPQISRICPDKRDDIVTKVLSEWRLDDNSAVRVTAKNKPLTL